MPQSFDLLIRGGTLVTPSGTGLGDVGVLDGKIAAIGELVGVQADQVIDARGLHVLPGVIDTQVHFREPGLEHKEDLATGSDCAVLGGVTAVFEMPNTNPPTTDQAALQDKLQRARGRMRCDHAFFMGATPENADEIDELSNMPGCCGVKVFMGSSTGSLLVAEDAPLRRVFAHARRRISIHAEDEFRLRDTADRARPGDWSSHYEARDVEAAVRATTRCLNLARETGAKVHVLHISTAEEVPLLAAAKDVATMEVTPQHLTLVGPEAYERLDGKAQMNPPVREARHREALWEAVRAGVVDVLGSDHAPHTLEEKAKPYPASPSGMPGVQTLVPVMLDHVNAGRLTLERFVDLTAHGAQRLFQIRGKGRLVQGYDADFTIVDMNAVREVRDEDMATRCGWTPFVGMTLKGWPVMTIIRGDTAMREGEFIGDPLGQPVKFHDVRGG